MRYLYLLLCLLPLLISAAPPAQDTSDGWLVVSRRVAGQSDLYAMPATSGAWQQLTASPDDERWPAFHPDGHTLAYAARRDSNWDIYSLDLRTGTETRLTTDPHFDGYPAWSPDGEQLAYASTRTGDLDIRVQEIESSTEITVTASSRFEYAPQWEDDETLLFITTRDGLPNIYRLPLGEESASEVVITPASYERQIMLLPDGDGLLTVQQNDRQRVLQAYDAEGDIQGDSFSWTEAVTAAALAPAGAAVAWLEYRDTGFMLYRREVAGGAVTELGGPTPLLGDLAWGQPDDEWMAELLQEPSQEVTPPYEPGEHEVVLIDDLDALGPYVNNAVEDSYGRLRAQVASELGNDFLGTMSEMLRPLNYFDEESDYLSWHKTGRAFDTLLVVPLVNGFPAIEVVREDWNQDVYWRVWLRCSAQDGSCGEPMVEPPWDFSVEARTVTAPGLGGLPRTHTRGYYVDMTMLAEDEGWYRISSHESADFDWRTNRTAVEFWHYQRTDGLLWDTAMREILSDEEYEQYFSWQILQERDYPRWLLKIKGIPLPVEYRTAPAELVFP